MSKTTVAGASYKTNEVLQILRDNLPALRAQFGVTRLALFGSIARGEASVDSDVDLLVELERPLGFAFVDLATELEKQLGRPVDLATFNSFRETARNPRRRAMIVAIEEDMTFVEAAP